MEKQSVGSIREILETAYPPHLAESWDAVGLICGDPADTVEKVAFALDCTAAVADAAIEMGAQLLVVHHPLLLRGVTSVAADTPKGQIVHKLIRAGVALFAAHTNADSARPGVNDALAARLGIKAGAPLAPQNRVAGDPELDLGIGRVGELIEPCTLQEFTARVAAALPQTTWGVRAAGDPQQLITKVAVASGAGDSFLDTARALGVDCLVTSDLRHHPVDEYLRAGGVAVIDTAHWASEFPWVYQASELVATETARAGAAVDCEIIEIITDPWTLAVPGSAPQPQR